MLHTNSSGSTVTSSRSASRVDIVNVRLTVLRTGDRLVPSASLTVTRNALPSNSNGISHPTTAIGRGEEEEEEEEEADAEGEEAAATKQEEGWGYGGVGRSQDREGRGGQRCDEPS